MKKYTKGFSLLNVIIIVAVILLLVAIFSKPKAASACFLNCPTTPNESTKAADVQKKLTTNVPLPQLEHSLERENVSRRAQIFNTPDKVSYIYLISYGKVMAFYSVKGKVSSLQSYMVPTEKIVTSYGNLCSTTKNCYGESGGYVVAAPDIDGTYGENVEGIFFFTTEDAYVEWKGEYMMSDQPLKLTTQPELIRAIK